MVSSYRHDREFSSLLPENEKPFPGYYIIAHLFAFVNPPKSYSSARQRNGMLAVPYSINSALSTRRGVAERSESQIQTLPVAMSPLQYRRPRRPAKPHPRDGKPVPYKHPSYYAIAVPLSPAGISHCEATFHTQSVFHKSRNGFISLKKRSRCFRICFFFWCR